MCSYKTIGENLIALGLDSKSLLLMTNAVRCFISKTLLYILFFPWYTVQTNKPFTSFLAMLQALETPA